MKNDNNNMVVLFAFLLVFAAEFFAGAVAIGELFQRDSIILFAVFIVANGVALIATLAYLVTVHASSGKEYSRLVFVRKKNGTMTVEER